MPPTQNIEWNVSGDSSCAHSGTGGYVIPGCTGILIACGSGHHRRNEESLNSTGSPSKYSRNTCASNEGFAAKYRTLSTSGMALTDKTLIHPPVLRANVSGFDALFRTPSCWLESDEVADTGSDANQL